MEPILVDLGSCTEAREQICGQSDAQRLQDWAEERCSIVYRAPEFFNVQSYCTYSIQFISICLYHTDLLTFNAFFPFSSGMIDERTDIWSLGCVLYAICFFKCPYDVIYEKGDSVALAVLSGNVDFPDNSPYSEVNRMIQIYPFFCGVKKLFEFYFRIGYAQFNRFYAANQSDGTTICL